MISLRSFKNMLRRISSQFYFQKPEENCNSLPSQSTSHRNMPLLMVEEGQQRYMNDAATETTDLGMSIASDEVQSNC